MRPEDGRLIAAAFVCLVWGLACLAIVFALAVT